MKILAITIIMCLPCVSVSMIFHLTGTSTFLIQIPEVACKVQLWMNEPNSYPILDAVPRRVTVLRTSYQSSVVASTLWVPQRTEIDKATPYYKLMTISLAVFVTALVGLYIINLVHRYEKVGGTTFQVDVCSAVQEIYDKPTFKAEHRHTTRQELCLEVMENVNEYLNMKDRVTLSMVSRSSMQLHLSVLKQTHKNLTSVLRPTTPRTLKNWYFMEQLIRVALFLKNYFHHLQGNNQVKKDLMNITMESVVFDGKTDLDTLEESVRSIIPMEFNFRKRRSHLVAQDTVLALERMAHQSKLAINTTKSDIARMRLLRTSEALDVISRDAANCLSKNFVPR